MKRITTFLVALLAGCFIVSAQTGTVQDSQTGGNIFTYHEKPYTLNRAFLVEMDAGIILILSNVPAEEMRSDSAVYFGVHYIAFDKTLEKQDYTYLGRFDKQYSPKVNFSNIFFSVSGFKTETYLDCLFGRVAVQKEGEGYAIDCKMFFEDRTKLKGSFRGEVIFYTQEEFLNLMSIAEEQVVVEAVPDTEEVYEAASAYSADYCTNGEGYMKTKKQKIDLYYSYYYPEGSFTIASDNGECSYLKSNVEFYIEDKNFLTVDKKYVYNEKGNAEIKSFFYYNEESDEYFSGKSGSLSVKKTGDDTYRFDFTMVLDNGTKLTGSYKGKCERKEYDEEYYDFEEEEIAGNRDLDSIARRFSSLEIDIPAGEKPKNILSLKNKKNSYALTQASAVKTGKESPDFIILSGDSLSVWWNWMSSFEEEKAFQMPVLVLSLPKDSTGMYLTNPLFFKSEYEDEFNKNINFPFAKAYFLYQYTLYTITGITNGFVSIDQAKDSAYVLDFTLLYSDSIYITGNYSGKIPERPEAKYLLNYLQIENSSVESSYLYFERKTATNPFPDFNFDEVTIENGFSIDEGPVISAPYVTLLIEEDQTGKVITISNSNSVQTADLSYSFIFIISSYPEVENPDSIWYYNKNEPCYSCTNALTTVLFVKATSDTTTLLPFHSAALRVQKTENGYRYTYKIASDDGTYTGAYEGEVSEINIEELVQTPPAKTDIPEKGHFQYNKMRYTQNRMYHLPIDLSEVLERETRIVILTDASASSISSLLGISNLIAFQLPVKDGQLLEGKFSFKSWSDPKFDDRKNFDAVMFPREKQNLLENLDNLKNCEKGTLDIRRTGDEYTIRYDLKMEGGKKLKGEYTGKANVIDVKISKEL